MRYCVRVKPDFNWFSLQEWVFDTSLQKLANVIPTAAVKQSAKVLGPLIFIFNDFLFLFVNHMGVKISNNISETTHQIHSSIMHNSWVGGKDVSTKAVQEMWNFKFWIFFFSLTWDNMGVKVSKNTSSESIHQMYNPGGGGGVLYQSWHFLAVYMLVNGEL